MQYMQVFKHIYMRIKFSCKKWAGVVSYRGLPLLH